jgi:soluble lytic murein transglycosylase
MSNRGLKISALLRHGARFTLAFSVAAHAQSPALIEAIRVHQPGVAERATGELEACLKVRCSSGDQLSLLAGALLLSESAAAKAVTQLQARKPPRGLEAFFFWYLGEAQAWSNAPVAALKSLARARAGAPAWLQKRIDLRSAELQLDLGQAVKARPTFETWAAAEPSPELILDRALARLATKDPEKGKADLRLLMLRYPTHPHARTAQRLLEAGGPLVWSQDELLQRAQAMLTQGDAGGSMATLKAIDDARLAQKVSLLRGQALLARGKDAEAVVELEAAATGASGAVSAEALMAMARRLMHQGQNADARSAFQRVDQRWPKDQNADEAGYLAAWLAMNSGDDETAIRDFAQFEVNHPSSRRRDEARWFRGFCQVRLGRFHEARETLRALTTEFPKSALAPQALYWATRAAQLGGPAPAGVDAGAPVDVVQELKDLASVFSGTFYARLAIERLHELGVQSPELFPSRPKDVKARLPPSLALAALLTKAGLLRDAWEEVQSAVGQVSGVEQALAYGHSLQSLGEFGAAHALAARYLWGPVYTLHSAEAVGLMYPRAWRESVEQWAEKAGVDPYFAWAIMRRESAFRPDVTSLADARGLMQLIPPTARQIAAETKTDVPSADDLYAPETNVRLGTWYLAALFARLDHPTLVAAAYNGGPSSVVKWVHARGAEPLDQWIEEIPFRETRAYVKQVVADYFIYQELYGTEVGRLSLVVPTPKAKGVDY